MEHRTTLYVAFHQAPYVECSCSWKEGTEEIGRLVERAREHRASHVSLDPIGDAVTELLGSLR